MKRVFNLAITAVLAMLMLNSCLDGGGIEQKYHPVETFDYVNFLTENPDSLYNGSLFYGSSSVHVFNVHNDEDKNFLGGFTISMKCDPVLKEGHQTRSPYCVADSTAAPDSPKGFAVFYQNPDPEVMKEHDIVFFAEGQCTAMQAYICNTNLVANLVKYGNDEIPKFQEGDYLKVNFKSYLKDKEVGSKTFDLAKYEGSLSVVTDWKCIDLSGLGIYSSIDITLSSNRTDIPLYFCLDELISMVYYKSE